MYVMEIIINKMYKVLLSTCIVLKFIFLYLALGYQNVICIVELVKEILHHDWSKAVHLKPIIARLYMIIQR